MYKIQVPGKLFLMGEYAVLEPGSLALVAAVNAYLTGQIEPSSKFQVSSELWEKPLTFDLNAHGLPHWHQRPNQSQFVQAALNLGFSYFNECGVSPQPFHLKLNRLDPRSKRGLGSSAAVTVMTIASLWLIHKYPLKSAADKLKLFKLAVLAHWSVQQGGSGADIAAQIFGHITAYTSFDSTWLSRQRLALKTILEMDWPYLDIVSLPWPPSWQLSIGWTGTPASTPEFIEDYHAFKQQSELLFHRFLFSSNAASSAGREAIKEADWLSLKAALAQAHRLLSELDQAFIADLETPRLKQLRQAAESLEGSGKFSGAGGGDCGIALVAPEHQSALKSAWEEAEIETLNLEITSGISWEALE